MSMEKEHSAWLEARTVPEGEVMHSMMKRIKELDKNLGESRANAVALKQENEKLKEVIERALKGNQEATFFS